MYVIVGETLCVRNSGGDIVCGCTGLCVCQRIFLVAVNNIHTSSDITGQPDGVQV